MLVLFLYNHSGGERGVWCDLVGNAQYWEEGNAAIVESHGLGGRSRVPEAEPNFRIV